MHVTTKDVDEKGTHILTSVLEGDGPIALASEKAKLSATVISVQRTDSGGVKVQTALTISEPAPEVAPEPLKPEDEAVAYLVSKGFAADAAVVHVGKFGATRVLAQRDAEKVAADKQLDDELSALLAPKKEDEKPTGTIN
ncbi:MAG TPA: hypothetical protein VHV32_19350 [Candidatus Angelobacter sp.]|jgi:hypothetical protein|nr:hypothetical protein [Candidatus Angelobacter sp.]